MLNSPTPQHTHDCDDCTLIANLGKDDLYVCCESLGAEEDTLIRRFGDDGPDYASFPVFSARRMAGMSMDYDLQVRLYDAFIAGRNSL